MSGFPLTQHGEEGLISCPLIPVKRMHFLDGNGIQFEDDISYVKACLCSGSMNPVYFVCDRGAFEAVVGLGPSVSRSHCQKGQGDQGEIQASPVKPKFYAELYP
jgi:hypothetical protein